MSSQAAEEDNAEEDLAVADPKVENPTEESLNEFHQESSSYRSKILNWWVDMDGSFFHMI